MKAFISISAVTAMAVLTGCQRESYDPSQVKIASEGISDTHLILSFTPPRESAYHCPGVNYTIKGEQVHYSYVRTGISGASKVDAPAKWQPNGQLKVEIPIPKLMKAVELIDSNGKSHGKWQIPAIHTGS